MLPRKWSLPSRCRPGSSQRSYHHWEHSKYTGACIPARQAGGDYYDFLELRPGCLALVLADVAGKGISGALIMANLQANLRSQYAMALDNLGRLLESVNRLFHENTSDESYATLFLADYDDSSRRLRYVNCGHLPALLLRAGQGFHGRAPDQPAVERLDSTSTVLGLFENWQCDIAEVQLASGRHPGALYRRHHRSSERRRGGVRRVPPC